MNVSSEDATRSASMMQDSNTQPGPEQAGNAAQAQHQAFQVNAQLPGLDMSILSQLSPEQIAAVGQLFLSGAIALPQTAAPQSKAISAPQEPVPQEAPNTVPALLPPNQQKSSDDDLEDGEVGSESEAVTPAEDEYDPVEIHGDMNARTMRPISRRLSSNSVSGPTLKRTLSTGYYARKEDSIDDFVRTMYANGYGFDAIKHEVSSIDALRAMYERLSLPVGGAHQNMTSSSFNNTTTSQLANSASAQPSITTITKTSTINPSRTTAITQPPPNRQEYLARLQAAKNKKTEVPAAAATMTKVKKELDPKKTELLKQKLAALKAETALKQQQAKSESSTTTNDVATSSAIPVNNKKRPVAADFNDDQPAKRLDTNADDFQSQRLIINVSDEEESSIETLSDDDAGVQLDTKITGSSKALVGETIKAAGSISSSTSGTSRVATPNNAAYEKMLMDIEAAKQQLAERERRSKSRSTAVNTPAIEAQTANTAPQDPASKNECQGFLPGISKLDGTTDEAPTYNLQPASDGSAIDDDEEFDDIYNTAGASEQPAPLPAADSSTSEDWSGTDSDGEPIPATSLRETSALDLANTEIEDTEDFYDATSSGEEKEGSAHPFGLDGAADSAANSSCGSSASMDTSDSFQGESEAVEGGVEVEGPQEEEQEEARERGSAGDVAIPLSAFGDKADNGSIDETPQQQPEEAFTGQANTKWVAKAFKPYESPLTMFKAYRHHPDFEKEHADKLCSLTWSHKIDPFNMVCPDQEGRDWCDNVHCQLQHYGEMKMPLLEVMEDLSGIRLTDRPMPAEVFELGVSSARGAYPWYLGDLSKLLNAIKKSTPMSHPLWKDLEEYHQLVADAAFETPGCTAQAFLSLIGDKRHNIIRQCVAEPVELLLRTYPVYMGMGPSLSTRSRTPKQESDRLNIPDHLAAVYSLYSNVRWRKMWMSKST